MNQELPSATGQLIAIFAGKPQVVSDSRGEPVTTSIFKLPVEGPVMVRTLNIDGDQQSDLSVHGGVDKAVYCYPSEHYASWRSELDRQVDYGAFGENLTVSGFLESELHIDDVLAIGEAVLQVSEPRYPCFKLGIKLNDPFVLRPFQKSGRSGFYCRVLQEGVIKAGQAIEVVERSTGRPTIADIVARVNRRDGI